MATSRHYSPRISRFLVSVLYHEAKHRKIPMTQLTDELLHASLLGTAGWTMATNLRLKEDTTTNSSSIVKVA